MTGQFARVDRSYLFLFSGDGSAMTNTHEWCAAGITPYRDRLQHVPVIRFPWLMQQLNQQAAVAVARVADLPAEADRERAEFAAQAILSLLVVPVTYGGGLAGFLGFDMVRAEVAWTDDDITLLRIVGEMLINALEHKRALAIQAGQGRFLELLATGGDFVETLHTLVRLIEEQWPGMLGLILLLDPDGRRLHIGAAVSLPTEYTQSIEGLEIGPMVGSCGTACYRRERVIVEDIAIDPRWEGLRALGLKYGLRACWSEPVFSADGRVVATFAMYYRQPRSPTGAELRAIQTAAHLVGVAIENRRAKEALDRAYQSLEQRVVDRTRELAALNAIAAVVSQSLDLKEILGAALDKVLEITGLEFGGAWRIGIDAGGRMERQALVCRGLSPAFVEYAARSSPSPRVVTLTAPTGQPVAWEVAQTDETYELKHILLQEGVRQVISIPLMAKGQLVGSMPLGTAQVRTFGPELLSLLAAIGQQVGMAVENARLFEAERLQHQESERRRLVAESLREYLKVLNSDLPLSDVLEHIVTEAGRLLGSEAVALFQLQPAHQALTIQAARGLDSEYVSGLVVPVGQGAVGRAVATRQPVILRPDATAPEVLAPASQPEQRPHLTGMLERYSVLVGVPLLLKTEVYGGLALYYSDDRVLSPEDLGLVSAFADQAALAIDNARLRERAESTAIAGERTRLSRELHDSVTQSLYSVTMFSEAAARMLTTGRTADAVDSLQALRDTAQEALRGMRLLIFQLRPPAIEKHGLAGALQARLDAVENRAGLRAELSVSGGDQLDALPLGCQAELYHIAQEALNNALKHAHAHQVHVSLVSDGLQTRLTVTDDGRGFEGGPAAARGGVGLTSMRERAQRLSAELQVASAPGKGTQITVIVPARGPSGNGAATLEGPPARALED
jgi:GAF domain-containing protein